jgi:hypothetical protein
MGKGYAMTDLLGKQTAENEPAVLENLAAEARVYSESLAMNMIQLGRVFTEAKKLVERGKWQEWVRANAGMSERSAQQFMAVYVRFGTSAAFAGIEKSKLFKMLSLPAGAEETFVAENDVADMTTREVDVAVKRTRAGDANAEQPTAEPEMSAPEAGEIPDDVREALTQKDGQIEQMKAELRRVGDLARDLMNENKKAKRDVDEARELLTDTQEAHNGLQEELLKLKSAAIRQEAEGERTTGGLTPEVFADAVRLFIGTVAQMPHMARIFAGMNHGEHERFDASMHTVEGWAAGAREALDTIGVSAGIVE